MNKNVLFTVISIILFACGKSDEKKLNLFSASNTFEENNFWINTNTIAKGLSHSGLFSSKIDSTLEYGIGIGSKFNNLTERLPKKVKVHCWIYSKSPNLDATLVCDPTINDQSINWQGLELKTKIIKANIWVEFTTTFDLPKNITPDSRLLVYFWNPKRVSYYVDDLDISLE
jgi:hypothetical protein